MHVDYNTLCLSITRNNSIMYVAVVRACLRVCVHACACVCGEGHLYDTKFQLIYIPAKGTDGMQVCTL